MECSLCGDECENVSHVFWECSVYSSTRASFMKKLQELLEDDCEQGRSQGGFPLPRNPLLRRSICLFVACGEVEK